MRDAVATVIALLPREAKPPLIKKLDTDASPVVSVVLAGTKTPRELFEIADRDVRDAIESVSGVGLVQVVGGQKRAINVWVDANRLAAYKIPILKVRDAVARQNSDIPGGRVDEGRRELVLRTMSRFPDPRQFNDLVVATIGNTPVRIRDIGYAEDGHKEQRTSARYDGKPAVSLLVQRQSGANSIEVINGVKARLERIRKLLPPGVTVDIVQDQSRYIEAAFHEVQLHLILGSILASLVVMLFMRNWRATVISAVAIPASIISTFGMMRALNFTLNNITMLALVLMVGVVIDDAIVVLENIFRYIEEKKDAAQTCGRPGHARHRPGGHGDHAQPGGHLPARVVHVQHFRTLPVQLRRDGRGGDPGIAAGQLQPDPDDELAHAAHRAARRRRVQLPQRILRRDRPDLHEPAVVGYAPSLGGSGLRPDRYGVLGAALSDRAPGVHPDQRGRERVRNVGLRPRRRQPGEHGGCAGAHRKRAVHVSRRGARFVHDRRGLSGHHQHFLSFHPPHRYRRAGVFSHAPVAQDAGGQAARCVPRRLLATRRHAGGSRANEAVHRSARSGAQRR